MSISRKQILAKDLPINTVFFKSKRKNAKLHYSAKIEIITGSIWSNIIEKSPELENSIFIMGKCGTVTAGQMILSPDFPLYVYEKVNTHVIIPNHEN